MVATHIVPRSGSFDFVSQMRLYIMWHIVTGTMLNLPLLILRHMKECLSKDSGKLSHGGLLTKLFKIFGVPLDAEVQETMKKTDTINQHTIAHMHWEKKNSVWGKIGQVNVEEEEERTQEDVHIGPPKIQSYASMETILDYLREMEGQLNVRLDSLMQRWMLIIKLT
ncbi:hypothetical protein CFOL_v3_12793 [Cephalotus follicularis]|uniref:Uncharacterized protein n=1 Tax=Cephalotus follicularis TaxID=3775 RepID=A0A1Q3BN54_CEPFO|nr:hypothetical protein CFOL_v3_12793 [Cephalotus follicularis]